MKLNRKGNIYFSFIVGIVVMIGIYVTSNIIINQRYESLISYSRVKDQYLAESVIDVQRSLLRNKFENASFQVFYERYEEPSDTGSWGYYAKASTYFFDQIQLEQGFKDISVETMEFLRKEAGFGFATKSLDTSLYLIDVDSIEELRLDNLCLDAKFWIDLDPSTGLNKSPYMFGGSNPEYTCRIRDLYFKSITDYKGGKIEAVFRISGMVFSRLPFSAIPSGESQWYRYVKVDSSNIAVDMVSYRITKKLN